MFRRVVVPLDGSALADTILPHVRQLAADTALEVLLLAVVPPPSTFQLAESLHETVDKYGYAVPQLDAMAAEQEQQLVAGDVGRAEGYLHERVQRLAADGLQARTAVRIGEAAAEIVRAADAEQADLIAMSTHGRAGLDHLLHGSVAEAVLRTAGRPVLVFRPGPEVFARQKASAPRSTEQP
jgi:nucleotide-binding universal stress UspA family protein